MTRCRFALLHQGKPAPRHCAACGLGPCKQGLRAPTGRDAVAVVKIEAPELARQLATRIEDEARRPIDEMAETMRRLGWPADLRRLILEETARYALKEAHRE